jgi:hypothetical protein
VPGGQGIGEVHRHAPGVVLVAHRIDTAATGKDVGLGAGLEEVVGGAADDVVDVDQDIALGIAANAGAVLEVDGHAGGQAA